MYSVIHVYYIFKSYPLVIIVCQKQLITYQPKSFSLVNPTKTFDQIYLCAHDWKLNLDYKRMGLSVWLSSFINNVREQTVHILEGTIHGDKKVKTTVIVLHSGHTTRW